MTSQWRHRNKTHSCYSELNYVQNLYLCRFVTYLWDDPHMLRDRSVARNLSQGVTPDILANFLVITVLDVNTLIIRLYFTKFTNTKYQHNVISWKVWKVTTNLRKIKCLCKMFQRVATTSSSVKQDATAYHNVKFVTETLTVLMAVMKPTAVRSILYLGLHL